MGNSSYGQHAMELLISSSMDRESRSTSVASAVRAKLEWPAADSEIKEAQNKLLENAPKQDVIRFADAICQELSLYQDAAYEVGFKNGAALVRTILLGDI